LATPGINLPPQSYWNAAGRGFPDVSAFGSNVLISSSGSIFGVGGTSCSSPIWAGIITLLNDVCLGKGKPPLGFLNPLLYQIWAARPSAFTDITVGDNICTEGGCSSSCYGFTCAVGWDPVTGLGTPVFTELLAYINTVICP